MKLFMIFIFFLACLFVNYNLSYNAHEGFRNESGEVFAYAFFGVIGFIGLIFVMMTMQN